MTWGKVKYYYKYYIFYLTCLLSICNAFWFFAVERTDFTGWTELQFCTRRNEDGDLPANSRVTSARYHYSFHQFFLWHGKATQAEIQKAEEKAVEHKVKLEQKFSLFGCSWRFNLLRYNFHSVKKFFKMHLIYSLHLFSFLLFPSQEMLGQLESLKLENRHLSEMVVKLELGLHRGTYIETCFSAMQASCIAFLLYKKLLCKYWYCKRES